MALDYEKTREEAKSRKAELMVRALAITAEKEQLEAEMKQIKRELSGLDHILEGVEFMTSEVPPDFEPPGFTDKIRKMLSETTVPLQPTQIRDGLEAVGVKGSSSRNLLISVHTVLERIKDELEESTTPGGKTAYRRKKPWLNITNYGPWADALRAVERPISNPGAQTLANKIREIKEKKK